MTDHAHAHHHDHSLHRDTHSHTPAPAKDHRSSPAATPPDASEVPSGTIYTCPMHPEIRQPQPGNCPKCGMALEPAMPSLEEDEHPELKDFTRRFWSALPLTTAVVVIAMFGHWLAWPPP